MPSDLETTWLAFLAAWDRGDEAGCLAALCAWEATWEERFWADDFSDFGAIYHEDVELCDHLGFLGTVDIYRGLDGFRGWRGEAADVASGVQWKPEEFHRLGGRFALVGPADLLMRYTRLPFKLTTGGVWTLRDRKIAKVELYRGRRRILRALKRGKDAALVVRDGDAELD